MPSAIVSGVQSFLSHAKNPLLVVLGPTAGGKTAYAISLAKELAESGVAIDIINADSRQLYRGFDIGTAKITGEEMEGIPHHLFSVLDPHEDVTIAWYQNACMEVIQTIYAEKRVPMLVGGSMLYISAVIDGLKPSEGDVEIRAALSQEYDEDNGVMLHGRLADLDPEMAERIPRQNKRYLVRALEIAELTGKKPSDVREREDSPYDLFLIGLSPDTAVLDARILGRTKQMMKGGWIEEVECLLRSGVDPQMPAMQSHGYREIAAWIANGKNESLNDVTKLIAIKTRQYAKRQRTWWRKDKRIRWTGM